MRSEVKVVTGCGGPPANDCSQMLDVPAVVLVNISELPSGLQDSGTGKSRFLSTVPVSESTRWAGAWCFPLIALGKLGVVHTSIFASGDVAPCEHKADH